MQTNGKAPAKYNIDLPSIEQIRAERSRIRRCSDYRKALLKTIYALILAAAVSVLLSTLFFPVVEITGSSMEPTLKSGDILVLGKSRRFKTGDLCGFAWNNQTLVKRVIGVPGDWISIDADGSVFVNGDVLNEPYLQNKSFGECDLVFPYQVPDHCLFVMGDQRENSMDSRNSAIGSVDFDQVIGKVLFRARPFRKLDVVRDNDGFCDKGA